VNVVYLGIDRSYSIEGLKVVKKAGGRIVASHLNKNKFSEYPLNYDVGISLGYLHKVPLAELKKCSWINIHPAPLPEYGGRNVAYHAIINEETHFGATIHYMNEEFDRGDIIETRKFEFSFGTTAGDLYNTGTAMSVDLLRDYIPKILKRKQLISTKQTSYTYYRKEFINDFIEVEDQTKRKITALYYPPFYPKIKIGNKTFIIKELT